MLGQAGDLEHALQTLGPHRRLGDGQAEGITKVFRDGQLGLGGGELGGEADPADEVLRAEDGLVAERGRSGRGQDAQDGLHQGGLATARGSDDRVETTR